jgi:hypothetical protein
MTSPLQLMTSSTTTVTTKLISTKNRDLAALNKFIVEPKNVLLGGFE